MGIFHYYNIDHAEVFVFDNFLIKQVKEGVIVDMNETGPLRKILEKHFPNENMVYVSNRITSYSVNPLVYREVEKISKMVAIGIIPANDKMRASAEYESQFYDKPFGIFNNLGEAIQWVYKIIKMEESKSNVKKH